MPSNTKSKSIASFLSMLVLMFVAAQLGARQNVQAQCPRPGFKLAHGDFSFPASKFIARDFNSDNKIDLASISYNGRLIVSLGDGAGKFPSQNVYTVDTGWLGITSGDINGDGKLDLILLGGNATYSMWLNNGAGGFSFLINLSYSSPFYNETQFIDFNGDGKADLVIRFWTPETTVLHLRIGNGAGNFAPPATYARTNVQGFVTGDFNGDGKKDVALTDNETAAQRTLTPYLNDGTGALTPGTTMNLGTDTILNQARDFNGDGKDDIIATTQRNTVTILLNNGSGGFTRIDHPLFPTINDTEVADFNGDGKLDVITAQYQSSNPRINAALLLGDGLGGFTRNDYLTSVPLGWTYSGDAADFNGDHMADIVVPGWAAGTSAGGMHIWQRTCNLNTNTKRVDYTGDGLGDFAIWRPSNGNWVIQTGSNSFRTQQWGMGSLGDVPVPGDYDGDGISDLAVFRAPTGGWYVLKSSDGSGFGVHWGASGDKPAPGDYDADGKTDFAVFRPSDGGWYILKSSDYTMASYAFGISEDKPVQFDYDGDDKTDVAVFRPSNGVWYVLKSSDGSYTATHFGQAGDRPVPGDYDGDGKGDLAVYRIDVGLYYLRSWNNSQTSVPDSQYFGTHSGADRPAPLSNHEFMGLNVWRPASGFFGGYDNSHSSVIGTNGDIPVTAPYVIE